VGWGGPVRLYTLTTPCGSDARHTIYVTTLCALAGALASTSAATRRSAEGDWTQYYGSATHDNSGRGKLRIDNPDVAWHVPDTLGQPTVAGDDVYAGGKGLFPYPREVGRRPGACRRAHGG